MLRFCVAAKKASVMAVLLSCRWLTAEEPADETRLRVASLVRNLGAESHRDRQAASRELARLGSAGRRELELAAQDADPEVRLRAADLLRDLKIADLWAPSTLRYTSDNEPASKTVAALAAQTGNRIFVGDPYGTFEDRTVKLDHEAGAYWTVIDELCRQSGNRVRLHYDSREPGIVLVAGEAGQFPTAYAGPLRGQITGCLRTFSEKIDYADLAKQQTHAFEIDVQLLWEDRFRLVAYRAQPELVEAVTDTGAALTATQNGGSGWSVASNTTRQLGAKLNLSPPPVAAKQLDRLVLKWGLTAVGDFAVVDISTLGDGAIARQDDVELTLESIKPREGNRYEMTALVVRDLAPPEPQDVLFQEYRLELFDANGRALRSQGQTNSITARGAQLFITFAGESANQKPATLRLAYPRIRSQHEVEITFRDVPLPTTRPQ